MSKVICFGSVGKDIFLPTNEGKIIETPEELDSQKKLAFELGSKVKIDQRFEALGGCAANVASGIKKLGIDADCVSNIGDDLIGQWTIEQLKKNGVGVEAIKIEADGKSDLSAIVVDKDSADRVIFTNKTSSGELNLASPIAEEADWFFITDVHGDWKKQIAAIISLAKEKNKKIGFNPREAHIKENPTEVVKVISNCEVIFVNKDEAIEIISSTGNFYSDEINNEEFLLKKLAELGAKVVALTDGKRGAWVLADGKTISSGEVEAAGKALDSTGAGDGFASGFISAYIKGKEIAECLKWGIAQSTNVVCYYGAIDGLLTEEEILGRI